MIHAKPILPDQYWILHHEDHKIGNIHTNGKHYVVSIGTKQCQFDDLESLCDSIDIVFDSTITTPNHDQGHAVHGYPTTGPAYNCVFDVQHQLPLWTSEPRSRSWLAAGWYQVRQHRNWHIMQCPKLIILQRYPYLGPFHSAKEAQQAKMQA